MDEAGSVDPPCRKRTSLKEAPTSTSGGVTSHKKKSKKRYNCLFKTVVEVNHFCWTKNIIT